MRFQTTLFEARPGVTGIEVPPEVLAELGGGKRPAVVVTVGAHTYRSTVGSMGGRALVPLSKENRLLAGVEPGQDLEIVLELDAAPRLVEVPDDLAAALDDGRLRAAFDALSPSAKKAHVTAVAGAKAVETRSRRIRSIVESLR